MRGVGGSRKSDLDDALRWGTRIIPATTVRRHGMTPVLDCIPAEARCVVTIDCDGLDPSVIPALLVPQPGGLNYFDVMDLFDGSAAKATIAGVDVVELVPKRDVNGIGALTAARFICKAAGRIAHQRDVSLRCHAGAASALSGGPF